MDENYYIQLITKAMHTLGIPANILGHEYIRTAILICLEDKSLMYCMVNRLYPSVAKIHNSTPSRVERAMRHAVEVAFDRGNTDMLNDLFGHTVSYNKGKVTNSEFIAMITDQISIGALTEETLSKYYN